MQAAGKHTRADEDLPLLRRLLVVMPLLSGGLDSCHGNLSRQNLKSLQDVLLQISSCSSKS